MNKVACEDHFSFENYIRMPIAATFWLLEKIRSAIERQYIYVCIYIYIKCSYIYLYIILSVITGIRDYGVSFFMQSIMDLFTFFMSSTMPIFLIRPVFVVVRLCFH